jgi:hypothetical protein
MSFALYVDPGKRDDGTGMDMPSGPCAVAYLRLTDLDNVQLAAFEPRKFPPADFTIAEIHPAQWDQLQFYVDRLSIVLDKSKFDNVTALKSRMDATNCDVTFNWDHRFSMNYYAKMLQYWIHCGAKHFSFYELTDFNVWQRLRDYLAASGYRFYDRYHACLPTWESPYQKHLAKFRDLYAFGGWSRVTDERNITRTRAPNAREWITLNPEEQTVEGLLFAMTDVEGLSVRAFAPSLVEAAERVGLVTVRDGRVLPTDKGLWDTVALVSILHPPKKAA